MMLAAVAADGMTIEQNPRVGGHHDLTDLPPPLTAAIAIISIVVGSYRLALFRQKTTGRGGA